MTRYPLPRPGVFRTIQGEGQLIGLPMIFVRLAGCSVGCSGCDTDYSVKNRLHAADIASQVVSLSRCDREWVWVTGGEPTDHDLRPLLAALRSTPRPLRLALATAGTRPVSQGAAFEGFDFVSVSPHSPDGWVQRSGDQVNLVPGLNGLRLADFAPLAEQIERGFPVRFVTPMDGRPEALAESLAWLETHPRWRLGIQAHKVWQLP